MKEVKAYLKNDLNYYLAQCNRHRSDLLADKVDHLTTLAKELNKQVMVEMGYGSTRYFELKHIALCEFMENFAAHQKEINLEAYIKLVK